MPTPTAASTGLSLRRTSRAAASSPPFRYNSETLQCRLPRLQPAPSAEVRSAKAGAPARPAPDRLTQLRRQSSSSRHPLRRATSKKAVSLPRESFVPVVQAEVGGPVSLLVHRYRVLVPVAQIIQAPVVALTEVIPASVRTSGVSCGLPIVFISECWTERSTHVCGGDTSAPLPIPPPIPDSKPGGPHENTGTPTNSAR